LNRGHPPREIELAEKIIAPTVWGTRSPCPLAMQKKTTEDTRPYGGKPSKPPRASGGLAGAPDKKETRPYSGRLRNKRKRSNVAEEGGPDPLNPLAKQDILP